MSEGYNFQLLTAIVKVIRPKDKPVIGIADGQGLFVWLPTEQIIMSHPMQYEQWQTTIFALSPDWKVNWKEEQNFEQFKSTYSQTIPIIQPIPQMFQASLTATPPQQPTIPTTPTQPANYPPQTPTVPQTSLQPQIQYDPAFADKLKKETLYGLQATDPNTQSLNIIAKELTNIRKLLQIYINPPKLTTADTLIKTKAEQVEKTEQDIIDEFGAPPEPNEADLAEIELNSNLNKDKLPDLI